MNIQLWELRSLEGVNPDQFWELRSLEGVKRDQLWELRSGEGVNRDQLWELHSGEGVNCDAAQHISRIISLIFEKDSAKPVNDVKFALTAIITV